MQFTFKIVYPNQQTATLGARTETEADALARALIESDADFVIVGPKWIGGSFRMTPAAHQALDRLCSLHKNGVRVPLPDVGRKCDCNSVGGGARFDLHPVAQLNCV
jgi:hypothetical protein